MLQVRTNSLNYKPTITRDLKIGKVPVSLCNCTYDFRSRVRVFSNSKLALRSIAFALGPTKWRINKTRCWKLGGEGEGEDDKTQRSFTRDANELLSTALWNVGVVTRFLSLSLSFRVYVTERMCRSFELINPFSFGEWPRLPPPRRTNDEDKRGEF